MSWETRANQLFVDGALVAELPFPIRESREIDGTVVMVLEVPPETTFSDNVFGYVLNSGTLWQLPPCGYYQTATPIVVIIGFLPELRVGEARLWSWLCTIVSVDVRTGLVVGIEISK